MAQPESGTAIAGQLPHEIEPAIAGSQVMHFNSANSYAVKGDEKTKRDLVGLYAGVLDGGPRGLLGQIRSRLPLQLSPERTEGRPLRPDNVQALP